MGELRHIAQSRRMLARSEGQEQRTALRFNANGGLSGHLLTSDQAVAIQNVSLGGCSVASRHPIPSGTHLMRVTAPDHSSTVLETRSVYCRPMPTPDGSLAFVAGFEFVRAPQDVDRAVRLMIEQVSKLRLGW